MFKITKIEENIFCDWGRRNGKKRVFSWSSFTKKSVLKYLVKLIGKNLCRSLSLACRHETFLKKRLLHRCFPITFIRVAFSHTPVNSLTTLTIIFNFEIFVHEAIWKHTLSILFGKVVSKKYFYYKWIEFSKLVFWVWNDIGVLHLILFLSSFYNVNHNLLTRALRTSFHHRPFFFNWRVSLYIEQPRNNLLLFLSHVPYSTLINCLIYKGKQIWLICLKADCQVWDNFWQPKTL